LVQDEGGREGGGGQREEKSEILAFSWVEPSVAWVEALACNTVAKAAVDPCSIQHH